MNGDLMPAEPLSNPVPPWPDVRVRNMGMTCGQARPARWGQNHIAESAPTKGLPAREIELIEGSR